MFMSFVMPLCEFDRACTKITERLGILEKGSITTRV